VIGIKNLQAFVAVVEELSFTKAAEKLYQTQPGLSIQVKNLENYLGAQLVERRDKGLRLTDAGAVFYPEAVRILTVLDQAKAAVNDIKGLKQGRLCVGASTLPGEYILPDLIVGFQYAFPSISVNLMIGDTRQIAEALKAGQIEIAFLGALLNDGLLEIREFRADELILMGPVDWPDDFNWNRFPAEKMFLREAGSGTRAVIEKHLAGNGIRWPSPDCLREVGSTRAIIKLVSAGLGISYLSRWTVAESLEQGTIKTLNCPFGSITRLLYAAVRKDSYLSYAAKAFWQFALPDTAQDRIGTEVL